MKEEIVIERSLTLGNITLNPNFYAGLREATDNGQVRIALEYATRTISDLWDACYELNDDIQQLRSELEEVKASKAPFRKTSKGNTPVEPPKDTDTDEQQSAGE